MEVPEENDIKYLLNLGMLKTLLSITGNAELLEKNILSVASSAYSLYFGMNLSLTFPFPSQKNCMVAIVIGMLEEESSWD